MFDYGFVEKILSLVSKIDCNALVSVEVDEGEVTVNVFDALHHFNNLAPGEVFMLIGIFV